MGVVAGISTVKDEADVVAATVVHLLEEMVDVVLVIDNGSTDGTRDILADLEREHAALHVFDDPEVAYYQSERMTRLAARAAGEHDASWIVPFDADECWYSTNQHLGDWIRNMEAHVGIVDARIINHFATSIDLTDGNPYERMVWRSRDVPPLGKVAVRWQAGVVIHQGNHGATIPPGAPAERAGGVELRHLPYRSWPQFQHKVEVGARAYAATDLPYDRGAHWRSYGEILERHGVDALREVWDRWFHFASPIDAGMTRDPSPWCRWRAG